MTYLIPYKLLENGQLLPLLFWKSSVIVFFQDMKLQKFGDFNRFSEELTENDGTETILS